jgi:hypothetical protein
MSLVRHSIRERSFGAEDAEINSLNRNLGLGCHDLSGEVSTLLPLALRGEVKP